MAIPTFDKCMLPLLKFVSKKPYHVNEITNHLSDYFNLTESEKSEAIKSGKSTKIKNKANWAKTYLKQAGLVSFPNRGFVEITPEGLKVVNDNRQSLSLDDLKQYKSFQDFIGRSTSPSSTNENEVEKNISASTQTPDEIIEEAFQEINNLLESQILERLKKVEPSEFENIIVDLLIGMGYGGGKKEMGEAIGRSGDGGIDGIIKQDVLGLEAVYIQAKRYSESSVGSPELNKFVGALAGRGSSKGVFVTTSKFTQDALSYRDKIPQKIILIDGLELAKLMIRYNIGVRTEYSYEIKKIDEDYFDLD